MFDTHTTFHNQRHLLLQSHGSPSHAMQHTCACCTKGEMQHACIVAVVLASAAAQYCQLATTPVVKCSCSCIQKCSNTNLHTTFLLLAADASHATHQPIPATTCWKTSQSENRMPRKRSHACVTSHSTNRQQLSANVCSMRKPPPATELQHATDCSYCICS
jgi:hypothetical protein